MAELDLLTAELAKVNCASDWANQTAGRSGQNGGTHMATVVIYAVGSLRLLWSLTTLEPLGVGAEVAQADRLALDSIWVSTTDILLG